MVSILIALLVAVFRLTLCPDQLGCQPSVVLVKVCAAPGLTMPYQFWGQQYIRILYPELIIYITEQSVLFVDCISQTMFLDIAKLVDGFPCLC